jgi:hypothetical protein
VPRENSTPPGPPRNHPFRPRPYLRRGQAGGDGLIPRRTGVGRDEGRRAVTGVAEDDRLVGGQGRQIQDR